MSNSPEKLLQKGRGGGQYMCDLGEGGTHAVTYIFLQFIELRMEFRHFKSQDQLSVWEDVLLKIADQTKSKSCR